jgi:uncharacterized membrane protein YgcG
VMRRTIDPAEHWVIPKRRLRRALIVAAGLSSVPLLAGCTPLIGALDFGGFLCVAGVIVFVLVMVKIAGKGGKGGGGSGCGGGISFGCGSGSSGCGGGGCGGGGD